MNSTKMKDKETAVLIAVRTGLEDIAVDTSLDELEDLAETAGAVTVGRMIQNRPAPDTLTYFGEGKVQELVDFVVANEIDLIIADDELSPVQAISLRAFRSQSAEPHSLLASRPASKVKKASSGELAQLKYTRPDLKAVGKISPGLAAVSHRGPGETKLEVDHRCSDTRSPSSGGRSTISKNREVRKKARKMSSQVALVGILMQASHRFLKHWIGYLC